MPAELGYAALPVIPSLRGAQAIISRELSAASKTAGVTAGRQLGTSMTASAATVTGRKSALFTNIEKGAAVSGVAAGRRFGTALHSTLGEYTKQIGAMAVGFFAFEKVKDVISETVKGGQELAQQQRLTDSAIKATGGAAGVTAAHVDELAKSLGDMAGTDDVNIIKAENLLLTFREIKAQGGIFDQATEAAVNMGSALAAASGGAVNYRSAVTLVGKALNDPVKGLTAMTRVGVNFSDQQKEQIKTLVASGKRMEAQKVILRELQAEYGGAAKAMRDPMTAAQQKIKALEGEIGTHLIPILGKLELTGAQSAIGVVKGVSAIPGPVKAAAAAWLAYKVASKMGATDAAITGLGRVQTGMLAVRSQSMLAAQAYRQVSAAEVEAAAGGTLLQQSMATARGDILGTAAAARVLGASATTGLVRGLSGAMALIGGPWGAAMIGGTLAVTKLWQAHQEAKQHVDDLTASLNAQTGAVTSNTAATVAEALQKKGAVDAANQLGVSLKDLGAAAMGNEDAFHRVVAEVNASSDAHGMAAFKIIAAIAGENAAVDQSKTSWSQKKQITDGATASTRSATSATDQNTSATARNTSEILKHIDALNKDRDSALKARQDRVSLVEQMQATALQARNGAHSFDINTKAGQANQEALHSLAEQWNGSAQSVQNARGLYALIRKEFIQDGVQMGLTRKRARDLAGELLHVPTRLPLDTSQALTAIERLRRQLAGLHDKTLAINVRVTGAHAKAVQDQLPSLPGRALGGPVHRGRLYVVGERGPELFVPDSSGTILSNARAGGNPDHIKPTSISLPQGSTSSTTHSAVSSTASKAVTKKAKAKKRKPRSPLRLNSSMSVSDADSALMRFAKATRISSTALGAMKKRIDANLASYDALKSAHDDLASAITSSLRSDLFSQDSTSTTSATSVWASGAAGTGANPGNLFGSAMSTLASDITKSRQTSALEKVLKSKGLTGAALDAVERGGLPALQAFAAQSKASLANYQRQFGVRQRESAAAGKTGADAAYKPQLDRLEAELRRINKTLNAMPEKTGKSAGKHVGAATNRSAAAGRRRARR